MPQLERKMSANEGAMMATVGRTRPGQTHEVRNQTPELVGHNAFGADPALREAILRDEL